MARRKNHVTGGERRKMASNDYHFVTYWRVEGSIEEVYRVLSDATDLVRWWPAVYLDVKELEPGKKNGIGKVVSLHTRGWLPYTLLAVSCDPSEFSHRLCARSVG
jgi:hypothetical protein